MDTAGVVHDDIGEQSPVVHYCLHIDGMRVFSVAVVVCSICRGHKWDMCAVYCRQHGRESSNVIESLPGLLLFLRSVGEVKVLRYEAEDGIQDWCDEL